MVKRITKRHLLAALCAAALLVTQLFVFRPMASEAQAAQPIPLWMQETDSIPVNEAGYCSVNIVFEQTDVSGMAYLEFDYFVKDYEAFKGCKTRKERD